MKGKIIFTSVVALHVAGIGLLIGTQGCGTARPRPPAVTPPPPPPSMPAPYEAEAIPSGPHLTRTMAKTPPPAAPAVVSPVVRPPAPGWGGETTEYVVQKGDSLSLIAKRYNASVSSILQLNGMTDANRVRVGQKLLLPGKVDIAKPREVKPRVAKAVAAPGQGQIVVRKGDSLSVLAKRNGTTTKALREANKLPDDRLHVGQVLVLPAGAKAATAGAPAGATPPAPAAQAPGSRTPAAPVSHAVEAPRSPAITAVTPPAVAVAPDPGVAVASDEFLTHTVGPDEDIYTVAMRYTVLPDDLKRWNNLTDSTLRPGQKLRIKVPQNAN